MISATKLIQDLANFTGSEQYYLHWSKVLKYTTGVKYLAEKAQAYWLIDAIASHQTKRLLSNENLRYFQLWLLTVTNTENQLPQKYGFINPNPNHKAVLTCWEDTPVERVKPVIRQDIEFTDFPLTEMKLYVENSILLLPSEH
ncbi:MULTISPECIES: DUF6876 family protein [Nostocales]|jgi:hypothetical protein|uniref:Uncharacterized protein n=1 Tax=Dolichospermum flos-aquae UHCC 0037 TaxID=2590026 RepID=A0ACC7SB27_DOLFA|nr:MULTISPECIES: DUF6876 family protein [Nostocales]ALB42204.1 hypothetical protein AA650_18665 [Anabaena sp. WA102]MBO1063243.1 hypothetical protein [Anabaena sp. 54]MTJ45569.1 hypothetical protein [Dolichospermum flos-aquae UHCC 0037]OBQ18409.1 MAG: hypothetical protein AN486_12285 [Anabaena sp. AL93]